MRTIEWTCDRCGKIAKVMAAIRANSTQSVFTTLKGWTMCYIPEDVSFIDLCEECSKETRTERLFGLPIVPSEDQEVNAVWRKRPPPSGP